MLVDASSDAALVRVAAGQRGVVTKAQLRAAGLGRNAIAYRVAEGRLHPLYHGVYVVGHPVLVPFARELAAVLACGAGALLSHRSAARVHGMWSAGCDHEVEVTVVGRDSRHAGVRVHRVPEIDPDDVRRRDGIPLTAPARTLLDLAAVLPTRELERALAEAHARRLVSHRELLAQLQRTPRRRGATALRALLRNQDGPALTRSEAEDRLLALVRAARLPPPHTNFRVAGHEVDFLWQSERLVVEVDGYTFHSTRASFERDRRRDADLHAAGLRVMRVTWRGIVDEPEALVARLATTLAASSSPP